MRAAAGMLAKLVPDGIHRTIDPAASSFASGSDSATSATPIAYETRRAPGRELDRPSFVRRD